MPRELEVPQEVIEAYGRGYFGTMITATELAFFVDQASDPRSAVYRGLANAILAWERLDGHHTYSDPGPAAPEINPSQHCTAADRPYTLAHSGAWCGYPQPRWCDCHWCYPERGQVRTAREELDRLDPAD